MTLHFVETMDEVFKIVLTKELPPIMAAAKRKENVPAPEGEGAAAPNEPTLTH